MRKLHRYEFDSDDVKALVLKELKSAHPWLDEKTIEITIGIEAGKFGIVVEAEEPAQILETKNQTKKVVWTPEKRSSNFSLNYLQNRRSNDHDVTRYLLSLNSQGASALKERVVELYPWQRNGLQHVLKSAKLPIPEPQEDIPPFIISDIVEEPSYTPGCGKKYVILDCWQNSDRSWHYLVAPLSRRRDMYLDKAVYETTTLDRYSKTDVKRPCRYLPGWHAQHDCSGCRYPQATCQAEKAQGIPKEWKQRHAKQFNRGDSVHTPFGYATIEGMQLDEDDWLLFECQLNGPLDNGMMAIDSCSVEPVFKRA